MKSITKISSVMILLSFLLLITSCKKDDNPVSSNGNELVGTWVLTKIIVTSLGNIELSPETVGIQATFEMKSDKTFKVTMVDTDGADVQTGTWSTADGKVTLTGTGGTEVMPYTISGNNLTVTTKYSVEPYGEQDVKLVLTKQ